MIESLYQSKEKPSKKKITLVREEKYEVCMYENDENKLKTLAHLRKLHQQLDSSRPDDEWELRHKQFMAPLTWREDGNANVNLPIEDATIRNKVADEENQKTRVEFVPTTEDDIWKKDMIAKIWDFVWLEGDTDKEITKMRYCKNIFGSAVWFEGVRTESFTRYVPEYKEDGRVVGKPIREIKSWLAGKMIDIRNVWIDNTPDIEDARYCFILEQDLSYDQICALKQDPNFDKEAIDKLLEKKPQLRNASANGLRPFLTESELQDATEGKYALMHYYDIDKGMYIVTDDTFTVVLREGVNPFPHGELPISVLIDRPKYNEMYGKGECEMLESTKYERNTIRNQIIDHARASNTINLAIGSGVSFEQSELISGVMRIWNFDGNLGDAQFLKPPSQDSNLYNIENMLMRDATWITGIDVNSLVGNATKTAFEAKLQEQTKLKNIYESIRQFDYFMTRVARQRLANIEAFLPITTGKKITGDEKRKYRSIPLEGVKEKDVTKLNKNGKVQVVGTTLERKPGYTEFLELSPQKIKSNLSVRVYTPTTTPILQEMKRDELRELFASFVEMSQLPQFQQFLQKVKVDEFVEDRIKQLGFDPDRYIDKSADEEQEVKEMRARVLGDLPAPPHVYTQPTASRLIPNAPMNEVPQATL